MREGKLAGKVGATGFPDTGPTHSLILHKRPRDMERASPCMYDNQALDLSHVLDAREGYALASRSHGI
jgi:hypothetical protein